LCVPFAFFFQEQTVNTKFLRAVGSSRNFEALQKVPFDLQ
jgi:hypothetical protein